MEKRQKDADLHCRSAHTHNDFHVAQCLVCRRYSRVRNVDERLQTEMEAQKGGAAFQREKKGEKKTGKNVHEEVALASRQALDNQSFIITSNKRRRLMRRLRYFLYQPNPIAPSPKCVPMTGPK